MASCTLLPALKVRLRRPSAALCRLTPALGCVGLTDGAPGSFLTGEVGEGKLFSSFNTAFSSHLFSKYELRGNGTPVEVGPSHGETHSLVAVESLG